MAELKRDGLDQHIPAAVAAAQQALRPVDPDRLTDRLTALGMMMAPNRGQAEATIWVAEMKRLLGDLPEDILGNAIDRCVKTSRFLPTVAEIRALADPVMKERRRLFAQLDAMARLIASGANIRPAPAKADRKPSEPEKPMTAEEAERLNAILERAGASSRFHEDGSRYQVETTTEQPKRHGPPRKPTVQDYVALGVDRETAERCLAEPAAGP